MSQSLQDYERQLTPARTRFATGAGLSAILSPAIEPALLEIFLIQFSAIGVHMTAPVEGWIRRAGERCEAIGLTQLGKALKGHAKAEADHDRLMVADARTLTDRWNARSPHQLDAASLLQQQPTEGVIRYRAVHEENITGDTPYAQIAIEYEIEQLSVLYGPRLIENCVAKLGEGVLGGLTFLTDHVELGVGHTKFNARQMETVIGLDPAFMTALVAAGSAALDAYGQFLTDCLGLAVHQWERQHGAAK